MNCSISFSAGRFRFGAGRIFCKRGIVDVFSFSNEKPYRITFFGNEVESIKTFDIETQLSIDKVSDFQLVSNMNFTVTGSRVSLLQLLPKESFVISKNGIVGMQRLKHSMKNLWKNMKP
jgi:transcription-repair coupling factor (superfamily II helicase)